MTVLIATQNRQIIKSILPKITFNESTKNTCTFKVTESKFKQLYDAVKASGLNPFALMSW